MNLFLRNLLISACILLGIVLIIGLLFATVISDYHMFFGTILFLATCLMIASGITALEMGFKQ
jgi:hypothetical protein